MDFFTQTLVGLVSFGVGCAREDYSGVNVRISAVVDWIDETICNISSFPPSTCPNRTPPQEITSPTLAPGGNANPPGGSAGQQQRPQTGNNNNPAPLYSPEGGSSSSQANADVYPGNGPPVATNAVTVNVLYRSSSQYVTWTLSKENTDTDEWEQWYKSPRGIDDLQSETFTNLDSGWWKVSISDPNANANANDNDRTMDWVSIMGPRYELVWGKSSGFNQTNYNIYFEFDSIGIVSQVNGG